MSRYLLESEASDDDIVHTLYVRVTCAVVKLHDNPDAMKAMDRLRELRAGLNELADILCPGRDSLYQAPEVPHV